MRRKAKAQLSHATALVVPGTGHNVAFSGCVPRLVASFVDQGRADGLDAGCLDRLTRPPFFTTFAGPKPCGNRGTRQDASPWRGP